MLESPYQAQLTSATAAALKRGYALVLLPGSRHGEWAEPPLDAVIVADPVGEGRIIEDLIAARIPVITDRPVEGRPDACWVDVDVVAAVRETLDHFEAQGARRPALVLPDSPTRFCAGVLAAYGDWCAEHGRPEHVVFAPEAGNGPVVEAVEEALSGTCRPDALCVVPEASPPLVLEAARRHGYDVPGDLLVVCVSEDATATHTRPALSALSLRPQEVAEAGIDLLVAVLEQGGAPSAGVLVQTRLEVRASSLRTGAGTD
ncbi:substrate-binding domain-containing protein [Streptomyces laculatispora]|uniref:Substrate-binding domain-containing protein n=1 Tax=Streptomyces laculatispora TaxID=887464 RepID=A0ABY9ICS6_9ACTN|nr:substrate-binding domain-containing protein [Streptomyces laculatispora]WLQ44419.1 substrate-binding domain-containing protein [Streptomyces laculatispora]